MAQLVYRVTGKSKDAPEARRVSATFRNDKTGREGAKRFALSLTDTKTFYDVRTRIGGRVVTKSFTRRKDADNYASVIEADKLRGLVVDPRQSRQTVQGWCGSWMAKRSDIRPTTRRLYSYLLDDYVYPKLGKMELGRLTTSTIRGWHSALLAEHPVIAVRSYQVLRAALNTAVADGVLAVNPCKVKGAGQGRSPERPVASIAEVESLANSIEPRSARNGPARVLVLSQTRRAEGTGATRRGPPPRLGHGARPSRGRRRSPGSGSAKNGRRTTTRRRTASHP